MAKFFNEDKDIKKEKKDFYDILSHFFIGTEKIISGLIASEIVAVKALFGGIGAEFKYVFKQLDKGKRNICTCVGNRVEQYYRANPEKRRVRRKRKHKLIRKFITSKNRIIEKEALLAKKMVKMINRVDEKNDEIAGKTNVIVRRSNKKINLAREWAEVNKRFIATGFMSIICLFIVIVAGLNFLTSFEYSYNGRALGMVKRQEDVLKIVDIVSEQLSKEHNAEIFIDRNQDITFKRIISVNQTVDDTEEVLKKLTYMKNMNAKGCAIYINGKRAAILDNKKTAEGIISQIKSMYVSAADESKYEKIGFKEEIKIKKIATKLGHLQNPDDVMNKLLTGAEHNEIHVVVAGETLSTIAKNYGITLTELKEANPNINPERLNIGQELIMNKPAPMLTIQTVEVATYIEPIPYETVVTETDSLYKGDKKVKVQGVNGERSVTARITKENGIQVASVELASEKIKDPITEQVQKGTKERPATVGSGKFIYPVSGARLTSKYGKRWGRMHWGIDLATSVGTRISASDGGLVIYAGYSGSYGNVVKIDHGNGYTTVYAHCSKLLVKKGDRVYQGQHIANVGNTGRSTGPHCHFEIQVNGAAKNPLNYL